MDEEWENGSSEMWALLTPAASAKLLGLLREVFLTTLLLTLTSCTWTCHLSRYGQFWRDNSARKVFTLQAWISELDLQNTHGSNWGIVSPGVEELRQAAQEIFSKPALNTRQVPASKRPYPQAKTNGWQPRPRFSSCLCAPLPRAMGINWSYCSRHKHDKQNKTSNNL